MEIEIVKHIWTALRLIILWLMVMSCQTIEPDTSGEGKPVVEGYLASGHPIEVKVTSEVLFTEADTIRTIDGLNMKVTTEGKAYPLVQDVTGKYKAASLLIKSGKEYSVSFDYAGKSIVSSTTIPPQPTNFTASDSVIVIPTFNSSAFTGFPKFPNPIVLNWDNHDGTYYLVVVKNIEVKPNPINTGTVERVFIFRSNPIQSNTFQIRTRQFQYYGKHWVILYKINAEYAALYQNNGSSSLNIKTPYTNVNNGLGIFTGINADTLKVRVKPR